MTARRRFVKDDAGQDLIEYGVVLGLIAVVALSSIDTLGGFVARTFAAILNFFN